MVHLYKHMAVRIWGALLLGFLASLGTLPLISAGLGGSLFSVLAMMMLLFMGIGGICNGIGSRYFASLLREASAWERRGDYVRAHKAFFKALRFCDSFVFSPTARRRSEKSLGQRLSRFYLARGENGQEAEAFIADYLYNHPDDAEVAEAWLRRAESRDSWPTASADPTARIADALPSHRSVQEALARVYLAENRTDFAALQIYRRLMEQNGRFSNDLTVRLAGLFLKERRADEWSLGVYLRAALLQKRPQDFLTGIAACVHWVKETASNRQEMAIARRLLKDMDTGSQAALRAGFRPTSQEPQAPGGWVRLRNGLKRASALPTQTIGRGLKRISGVLLRWSFKFRNPQWILRYAKTLLLSAATIAVIFLVVRFHFQLVKNRPSVETPPAVNLPSAVSTDPFTLQVAAYLKAEHAQRFEKNLREHGYDAFITEARGAQRNWFQVRISHFATKQSAVDFGRELKAKGVIEDFYVANYHRP